MSDNILGQRHELYVRQEDRHAFCQEQKGDWNARRSEKDNTSGGFDLISGETNTLRKCLGALRCLGSVGKLLCLFGCMVNALKWQGCCDGETYPVEANKGSGQAGWCPRGTTDRIASRRQHASKDIRGKSEVDGRRDEKGDADQECEEAAGGERDADIEQDEEADAFEENGRAIQREEKTTSQEEDGNIA
ncbi:hypothetical protein NDU88_003620 [Pleurodeles waltl]|uniref:Uncharacterized protein n=1 Tax=Pleurodeles waltl TaxID=8319 RepID=A0AAV7W2P5_PLEWA|nr:hypothetical protein NDU88_003620 [Pleurodeles waltl]